MAFGLWSGRLPQVNIFPFRYDLRFAGYPAIPHNLTPGVVDDLVSRLFDGEALPLFQHLINERGLSDRDLDELQKTLDEMKARARKRGPSR